MVSDAVKATRQGELQETPQEYGSIQIWWAQQAAQAKVLKHHASNSVGFHIS